MKAILILVLLLFNQINLKLTRKSEYDYSNYQAVEYDTNLKDQTVTSTKVDESALYINGTEKVTVENSNINKESGDSSKIENSEFFGVNAAILVQGGNLEMTGGTINTKVKGGNALVATNDAQVTIKDTKIESTGERSARGLHATYGGNISGESVTINTEGGSCATLATDRGEGVVSCTQCTLSTKGKGSPLIYSTGKITIDNTKGTSEGAQAVVIEGKNKAEVKGGSELKCNAVPNRGDVDQCGVMIYQSFSGDAETGTGNFICKDSSIEIINTSSYFSTAPMFFITNTKASIELEKCQFTYGSNSFLSIKGTSEWGKQGRNGGDVSLTLTNEDIEGNFIIDNISSLTLKLVNSKIKGTINGDNHAKKLAIEMDKESQITLTGNSYYTEFKNEKTDGSNLINGTYTWNNEKTSDANILIYSYSVYLLLLCGLLF